MGVSGRGQKSPVPFAALMGVAFGRKGGRLVSGFDSPPFGADMTPEEEDDITVVVVKVL